METAPQPGTALHQSDLVLFETGPTYLAQADESSQWEDISVDSTMPSVLAQTLAEADLINDSDMMQDIEKLAQIFTSRRGGPLRRKI